MAQPVPPKNNYSVALPSRLARNKIIVWHWPAGPAPEFPHKMVGHCVSPCGEPAKKLYGGHTGKIIWQHLAWLPRKKLYGDIGQPGPQKKIIWWHWLPAGTLTCHHIIIFSAKNHIYLIFARNRMPCPHASASAWN